MSVPTQDAAGAQNMAELLESVEIMKPLHRGDIVEGIVMSADPDGVLLNIGHKAEGIVPPAEMKSMDRNAVDSLKVGDEVLALVVKGDSSEGAAILSIDRAVGEMGWKTLEKALESGTKVEGKIIGFNRGGAIVESEGVQAFVPMSQLITISRANLKAGSPNDTADKTSTNAEDHLGDGQSGVGNARRGQEDGTPSLSADHPDVGRTLELKVLEVNRSRNRAILSERLALQEQRDARKAQLIEELEEGEVRKGHVTGISNFGVFVDMGGADGLIHISELSWDTVKSPEDVVNVGEEIDVYILKVDHENRKIALSIKRLNPEPWETISEQYHVGSMVDATITKLADFGAFARVTGSVEGLIHISELTSKVITHPNEVLKEGDAVKLKVIRIEPERRRLGLSLKQADEDLPIDDLEDSSEQQEQQE